MATRNSSVEALPKKDIGRSSRALRAVLDAASEAVFVIDPKGEIVFCNAVARELWGGEGDQWTGRSFQVLFSPHFSLLSLDAPEPGAGVTTEAEAMQADGTLFTVKLSIRETEIDGYPYRTLWARPARFEREESQARVEQRTFLAMEQLAGGLAHELNNVLTGVMGNLHLAMEGGGQLGRTQPSLMEGAYYASLRAREVARQLVEFSNGDGPELRAGNLLSLLRENTLLALGEVRTGVEFAFAEDLHAAYMDPSQVGQMIGDLVSFASGTTGHSGCLRFSGENRTVACADETFGGQLLPGDYVRFAMEVEGSRIHAEDLRHLFEPHADVGGFNAGMSLAIARGMVKRHDGLIFAEPGAQPGGFRVVCYLPACADVPNEAVTSFGEQLGTETGVRILIMDDEQLVRLVLQRTLEGLGHRVEAAMDGEEAIELYEGAMARGDRFDLVLLDIQVTGGMGAEEACQRLRERDPLATCVVTSGSIHDPLMMDWCHHGFAGYLDKPFDGEQLEELIAELAGERPEWQWADEDHGVDEEEEEAVQLPSNNIVEIDFTDVDRF